MERVPTLKSELSEVLSRFKGHIIGTTACLGGELGQNILSLNACEVANDMNGARRFKTQIGDFIEFCINTFGQDDFYIECAPASSEEQVIVNKRIESIAKCFGVKICIGTDAHYLTTEDRYVHEAYLNSKGGERETASF